MRISSGTKNPYHIYFPKTDTHGCSALVADDFCGQFKDHWAEGLMDYNGNLEVASQTVVLFLFDVGALKKNLANSLAWPLLPHEKTMWSSRQEKVDYLLSCRNEQYRFSESSFVVSAEGELSVEVLPL